METASINNRDFKSLARHWLCHMKPVSFLKINPRDGNDVIFKLKSNLYWGDHDVIEEKNIYHFVSHFSSSNSLFH